MDGLREISRRALLIGGFAVLATCCTGGAADASAVRWIKTGPSLGAQQLCMQWTNTYMNLIWESHTSPKPGVNYGFEIQFAEDHMDIFCNADWN
jgi:hypothetical protein